MGWDYGTWVKAMDQDGRLTQPGGGVGWRPVQVPYGTVYLRKSSLSYPPPPNPPTQAIKVNEQVYRGRYSSKEAPHFLFHFRGPMHPFILSVGGEWLIKYPRVRDKPSVLEPGRSSRLNLTK